MTEQGLAARIWISAMMAKTKCGGASVKRMVSGAGGPEAFFETMERRLRESAEVPPEAAASLARFLDGGKSRTEALLVAKRLQTIGAGASWHLDADYPERLLHIPSSPPVLFYRSTLSKPLALLEEPSVAVIGTRQPSPYGEEVATRISRDLTLSGVLVVSGLALGIDTCAHAGALDAGGATVAVLANGIDGVYPRENGKLADRIVAHGVLLSEMPPGTPPKANFFPARNRIISGLCDATAVIEAAARSGTMITAGCALDQGRDVFAVPGSIFNERSDGTNQLIKEGAYVLTGVEDILERLPSSRRIHRMMTDTQGSSGEDGVGGEEDAARMAARLMTLLENEFLDADAISLRLGVGIRETTMLLLELELSGVVRKEKGRYQRGRRVL